ncbi:phage major tail tube protein, partial [Salmonella enterica subsp. enterica serovar Lubbock]|nr:phage major tail tube protein [Salmonella enterica subsp. enterica serovar Lubbock]
EWKTGESNTTKVTSTNSYAKLTINGEVLYEVDLINMVETVDGQTFKNWQKKAQGIALSLPELNPYIPDDFTLVKNDKNYVQPEL